MPIVALSWAGLLLASGSVSTTSHWDPALDHAFDRHWTNGGKRPDITVKGLGSLDMVVLHHAIMTRPPRPDDAVAERRLIVALNARGLGLSPTDALRVTCRSDLCETLFIDRRPSVPFDAPSRPSQADGIVGRACRDKGGYAVGTRGGVSVGGSLSSRREAISSFCVHAASWKERKS